VFCLAAFVVWFAAKVFSENDEKNYQCANVHAEQSAFEYYHQQYDNPQYITT